MEAQRAGNQQCYRELTMQAKKAKHVSLLNKCNYKNSKRELYFKSECHKSIKLGSDICGKVEALSCQG